MRLKFNSLKWLFFIFSMMGFTLSFILFLFPTNDLYGLFFNDSQTFQNLTDDKQDTPPQQIDFGLPVRLKISNIKVDTTLESVGLTSDGAVDVPKKQDNAAWFNLGPRPGEIGNAVITGHYGWKDKKPSVFDDLYKLREGDKLYIEDDQGKTITFVVRTSQRYDPDAEASEVFVSNDGKSHLNLITCEGVWNDVTKSYSKRLVVFADKE